MGDDKHIPLENLAAQVEQGVRDMQSGNMSKEGMERLQIKSRDLHERLTILRFKAFEAMVKVDEDVRFDKEDESQTNLIDSIAEVTAIEMPPKSKKKMGKKSLAESLQSLPLSSIGAGLTILDRANFTSTLFSNDTKNFNDMLDSVDACRDFEAACEVFHKSINTMGTKPEIESAIDGFKMRITRRFQS
ncbi:MAG: hypothetical protein P8L64_06465 [Flavobacteriales bacterium]|nr:hypothetical protein [Flavobacteriales bacterium]